MYNVLNGLMRLRNVDIYVTGSNSKLLSQDVMTAFRGRGDQLQVFPLTFKEYFEYVGGDKSEAYEEYALYVGMPQLIFFKHDKEKMNYLKNLFSEVYFKDISEYNELIYRGYAVDVGVVEVSETSDGKRVRKQCEIDFVVNMGSKRYYIQSALSVSEQDKLTTELRPLKNTNDFFKKIIITKTHAKPWTDEDGILHIGLYDFLLNQNCLEA